MADLVLLMAKIMISFLVLRDIVKILLQHNANVHITEKLQEQTPLVMAASLGDAECMRLLLDNKADPNYQDIFGHTPLHHSKDKWVYFSRMIAPEILRRTKLSPLRFCLVDGGNETNGGLSKLAFYH